MNASGLDVPALLTLEGSCAAALVGACAGRACHAFSRWSLASCLASAEPVDLLSPPAHLPLLSPVRIEGFVALLPDPNGSQAEEESQGSLLREMRKRALWLPGVALPEWTAARVRLVSAHYFAAPSLPSPPRHCQKLWGLSASASAPAPAQVLL